MKMKKILLIFYLFILIIPSFLSAQILEPQLSPEEVTQSMEANLTWNLQNEILNYYPDNKFVVKANIRLYRSRPQPAQSTLPSLPNVLLSKGLNNLPGLPVIPDKVENEPQGQSLTKVIQEFFEDSCRFLLSFYEEKRNICFSLHPRLQVFLNKSPFFFHEANTFLNVILISQHF